MYQVMTYWRLQKCGCGYNKILKNFYVSGDVRLAFDEYDCGCNQLECKEKGIKILTMKCQEETFEFYDSCWEQGVNYRFCEECVESGYLEIKTSLYEDFPYTSFTTDGIHDDY